MIDFIDHIIEKFPFRIREVRTDNGHELQAKFHWHVDLEAKLDEWERFYNFARPHGAHNGQTPHEALRDKLQ